MPVIIEEHALRGVLDHAQAGDSHYGSDQPKKPQATQNDRC